MLPSNKIVLEHHKYLMSNSEVNESGALSLVSFRNSKPSVFLLLQYQFPPGINKSNTDSDVDCNRAPCHQSRVVAGKRTAGFAHDVTCQKWPMSLHHKCPLQLTNRSRSSTNNESECCVDRQASDGWVENSNVSSASSIRLAPDRWRTFDDRDIPPLRFFREVLSLSLSHLIGIRIFFLLFIITWIGI